MKTKGVLGPTVVILAVAATAAACGSNGPSAANQSGSTTTTVTTVPATTTTTASTSTTRGPTTTRSTSASRATGGSSAGGPVPAGFDPVSFTAISANEYWLLGEAPCSNPVCTSIVRTTDGGTHFVGLPAPTSPLDTGTGITGGVNTLRFADAADGYAYDSAPGGAFWDTHDGGQHWSQPGFISGHDLLAFGTGAGYAFALVGSCQGGTCTNVVLDRSPVSSDQWTALSVPVPAGVAAVATMTVLGSNLWFSVSANQPNQLLVEGTASGASFKTGTSPCQSGLSGTIQATSAEVLWAVCPSGTLAQAFRSTDGGAHWVPLSTSGELPNSAVLAPASDTTAVLGPTSQATLLMTSDGGATWQAVPGVGGAGSWAWIGFTDATTGSALVVASSTPANWPWPKGPMPEQLWRTADGGTTWSGPVTVG